NHINQNVFIDCLLIKSSCSNRLTNFLIELSIFNIEKLKLGFESNK
ncbi:MAG: hypothetical protein ACI94O_001046, partial [Octadecabacter sp.]